MIPNDDKLLELFKRKKIHPADQRAYDAALKLRLANADPPISDDEMEFLKQRKPCGGPYLIKNKCEPMKNLCQEK